MATPAQAGGRDGVLYRVDGTGASIGMAARRGDFKYPALEPGPVKVLFWRLHCKTASGLMNTTQPARSIRGEQAFFQGFERGCT